MKKVLALVAAAMLTTAAFAEKVVEVGLKGGLLLNAGTKFADDDGFDGTKMSVGGDIGIFGHFGLAEIGSGALSLQPELFFSFANGLKTDIGDLKLKYNSLDIAVLLGYDIPLGKARITPFLGPKVGIPLGKARGEIADLITIMSDEEIKVKGVTVGLDFGAGFAIPLGSFVLGADIRYGIDFNKSKAEIYGEKGDFLRRGALGINVTAGWRF